MGRKYLFTGLNAILVFTQISNIIVQAAPEPKGKLLTPEDGCGISNVANTKIVGGLEAKPGEYPWIALLLYKNQLNEFYPECGGTLITSRHVLTAAHCLGSNLAYVRLGEHDLRTIRDGAHLDLRVVKSISHPNYNDEYEGSNDVAVLTMERDVKFNNRLRPICLPLSNEFWGKDFIGQSPFIAGWGDLKQSGNQSNVLMHVQVPVQLNSKCKEIYRMRNKLLSDKEFGKNTLCAGYWQGGKDSCHGDSGGPLMLPFLKGTFRMYQIGIISYGIGCADQFAPGVYANVHHFTNWIRKTVNGN